MTWMPTWVGHPQASPGAGQMGVKAFSHPGRVFPLGTSSERDLGCVETGALDTWLGWWVPP